MKTNDKKNIMELMECLTEDQLKNIDGGTQADYEAGLMIGDALRRGLVFVALLALL